VTRSFKLLAIALLIVTLPLSSAQIGLAAPQISLSPTCGPSGTVVTVAGSGFALSAQPYCDFASTPSGLIGSTRGTDFSCYVDVDGSLANTWFIVAAGASGSYSVTVTYFGQISDPVTFNAGSCLSQPSQQPFGLCVARLGVQEPNGTVTWLSGYAYPGTPVSGCQNKTEVLGQDVLDRTIVLQQFNQTRNM
jgi:hypothetical protein